MKSFAAIVSVCLMLFFGIDSVTAFAPTSTLSVGQQARSATRLYLNDPEMLHHIASNFDDATRLVLNECNTMECQQVSGYNQFGEWVFPENGLSHSDAPTKAQLLMVEHDDCE